MFRFITPVILIGVAVAGFFIFTRPIYSDISSLREESTSYNDALTNSKALETERDKLTAKYNAISQDNLDRLTKLLPENIDNIRLILEIEKIASPYGMVLKDVKYNAVATDNKNTNTPSTALAPVATPITSKDYGVWDLEFSTGGTYNNFLNFTRDLENNLRIVDISSIDFSSNNSAPATVSPNSASEFYQYNFKIKTYWLKN